MTFVLDNSVAMRWCFESAAHGLALAYRLTSYDAAYLELALRRSPPLATLDDDLIRASTAAGVTVL